MGTITRAITQPNAMLQIKPSTNALTEPTGAVVNKVIQPCEAPVKPGITAATIQHKTNKTTSAAEVATPNATRLKGADRGGTGNIVMASLLHRCHFDWSILFGVDVDQNGCRFLKSDGCSAAKLLTRGRGAADCSLHREAAVAVANPKTRTQ
jgi:hypothetical protein